MNQHEFGRSLEDSFGHREDDHYFMDEKTEKELRDNKMKLDHEVKERKKKQMFLLHQNDEVYDLCKKVDDFLQGVRNGFVTEKKRHDVHIVNISLSRIRILRLTLEDLNFKGTLSELASFKAGERSSDFVDTLLDVMVEFNFN